MKYIPSTRTDQYKINKLTVTILKCMLSSMSEKPVMKRSPLLNFFIIFVNVHLTWGPNADAKLRKALRLQPTRDGTKSENFWSEVSASH